MNRASRGVFPPTRHKTTAGDRQHEKTQREHCRRRNATVAGHGLPPACRAAALSDGSIGHDRQLHVPREVHDPLHERRREPRPERRGFLA